MLITSKGQVTIPQRIRNRYGLKPGTAVEFVAEGSKVVLKPKKRGKGKGLFEEWLAERPRLRPGMTSDKLMQLTRGED
jgi:AbrB family looped-hinge helix DNA binding protein